MNAIELSNKLKLEYRNDSLNYDTALDAAGMLSKQHDEIESLRDEIEQLTKDAERYRWLRDYENEFTDRFLENLASGGKRLEFAIDKAMEAK